MTPRFAPTSTEGQLGAAGRLLEVANVIAPGGSPVPFFGYGFDPSMDDPTVGAWMVWVVAAGGVWAAYDYYSTFEPVSGDFRWSGVSDPYPFY